MRELLGKGARFVLVGLVATLVHYLVILCLVDLLNLLDPTPATVVGSVFGIATAYVGNYHYVFGVDDNRHDHYVPRFVITYLIVMTIHASVMYLFVELLLLPYELGFITATALSAITTFAANNLVVFASSNDSTV
jgi:putative flippase GtrA